MSGTAGATWHDAPIQVTIKEHTVGSVSHAKFPTDRRTGGYVNSHIIQIPSNLGFLPQQRRYYPLIKTKFGIKEHIIGIVLRDKFALISQKVVGMAAQKFKICDM